MVQQGVLFGVVDHHFEAVGGVPPEIGLVLVMGGDPVVEYHGCGSGIGGVAVLLDLLAGDGGIGLCGCGVKGVTAAEVQQQEYGEWNGAFHFRIVLRVLRGFCFRGLFTFYVVGLWLWRVFLFRARM